MCCTAELSSTFLESNNWNTKVEMPQIPNGGPCVGPFRRNGSQHLIHAVPFVNETKEQQYLIANFLLAVNFLQRQQKEIGKGGNCQSHICT